MIFVTLLSIYINKILNIYRGIFNNVDVKIFNRSQNWYKSYTTSSNLTFDLLYDLHIHVCKVQILVMPISEYHFSTMMETEGFFFNDRGWISEISNKRHPKGELI